MVLSWRLLATLAGSLGPGEERIVALSRDRDIARIEAEWPRAMADSDDLFAMGPQEDRPSISAGMFGPGFSLRLSRAELQSAGGTLTRGDRTLIATIPLASDRATPEVARAG